jgi:dihydroorotate dehydrogenase (NAD+) catalytic subunit
VHQVVRAVSIPVIGIGGIAKIADVVEYLMIGAAAVQVGSATFTHPDTMIRLTDELADWLRHHDAPGPGAVRGTLATAAVRHELAGDAPPRAAG